MNRQFFRRSKGKNLKGFLSSTLTLMLILQIFSPGVFAINSVFAEPDPKVNVCHWSDDEDQFNAINISENGLNGHDGHEYDYLPGDIPEGDTFDSQWCMDHATNIPPIDPKTGSLTVNKVVVGTSTPASEFDLFVNGMPITSGVASTSIVVGSYIVTEEEDNRFEAEFSGACNAEGEVDIDEDEHVTCTITNTWLGGTGGAGEGDTFKVKILKYVDGVQANATTAGNYAFPFTATWTSPSAGSGNFTIGESGHGGSPAYQAWTSDMTGPADYSTSEITSDVDSSSNVLPIGAQCVEGKFRLKGYKTGTSLITAQAATLSSTAPSFNDISSERYVIVYNEKCSDDQTPANTATIHAMKVVCDSESDLPNWGSGGANITSTTASDYVASHPNCHLEPNWQFQWAPSGTADPGMDFVGAAGSPWTTFGSTTSITVPSDKFIWVREVLKDGYIPFTSTGGGAPNTNVSAEFYCNTDVLNYDNYDWIEDIAADHTYHCVGFNALVASTTTPPAQLTVIKNVVGGTATSGQFMINVSGASASPSSFRGNASGTIVNLTPNSAFSVTEVTNPDYTVSYSDDCDATSINQYHPQTCTITNTFNGTTSPFMVKIYKYLDGAQATASSSGNYEFPMQSTWDWSGSAGTGNYYLGLVGHGGSDPYQAFTSPMTGPADYSTHEITNNIDPTSDVLPVGAACEEGMFRLLGYKTGTSHANALAASLSTTSPSFTDIHSERHVIVLNETCEDETPVPNATGTIIINKVVINDNGGTGTTTNFSFRVNGTSTTAFEADGSNIFVVATGTHDVTEVAVAGYSTTYEGCDDISIAAGETKTCTITNNDIPPLQCPVTNGYIESDTNTMVGTSSAVLLSFVHPAWTADVDGASTTADWIWSTNPVSTTTATTTVTFTRTFTVNGSSTDATLNIASDNTYRVWINGDLVGVSTDGDNFTLASQDSFDVSNFLDDGTNTLTIEVTNLPTPDVTDPAGNPAGLLYRLNWEADDCPPVDNGGNGGTGGDIAAVDNNDNNNRGRSRTIIRGNNNDDDDVTGQVLGISTSNPNTPLGQVLGIATALPGLPYTGLGDMFDESNRSSNFPILVIGLLALGGLYLVQYRIRKAR